MEELQKPIPSLAYKGLVFIILLGVCYFCLLLAVKVLSGFGTIPLTDQESLMVIMEKSPGLAKLIIFAQHFFLFILTPLLYVYIVYKGVNPPFLSFGKPKILDFLYFGVLLMFMYPIMSIFALWMFGLELPEWINSMDQSYEDSLRTLLAMDTVGDLVIALLVVALIPGVGEELFFRGVLQKELFSKIGNFHVAIWLTAFLFSTLHFQFQGFIPKMLIGAVFGYAYVYTQSLIVPMTLHFANNAFATIAWFIVGKASMPGKPEVVFSWTQAVTLLFFVVAAFYYYVFITSRYKNIPNG